MARTLTISFRGRSKRSLANLGANPTVQVPLNQAKEFIAQAGKEGLRVVFSTTRTPEKLTRFQQRRLEQVEAGIIAAPPEKLKQDIEQITIKKLRPDLRAKVREALESERPTSEIIRVVSGFKPSERQEALKVLRQIPQRQRIDELKEYFTGQRKYLTPGAPLLPEEKKYAKVSRVISEEVRKYGDITTKKLTGSEKLKVVLNVARPVKVPGTLSLIPFDQPIPKGSVQLGIVSGGQVADVGRFLIPGVGHISFGVEIAEIVERLKAGGKVTKAEIGTGAGLIALNLITRGKIKDIKTVTNIFSRLKVPIKTQDKILKALKLKPKVPKKLTDKELLKALQKSAKKSLKIRTKRFKIKTKEIKATKKLVEGKELLKRFETSIKKARKLELKKAKKLGKRPEPIEIFDPIKQKIERIPIKPKLSDRELLKQLRKSSKKALKIRLRKEKTKAKLFKKQRIPEKEFVKKFIVSKKKAIKLEIKKEKKLGKRVEPIEVFDPETGTLRRLVTPEKISDKELFKALSKSAKKALKARIKKIRFKKKLEPKPISDKALIKALTKSAKKSLKDRIRKNKRMGIKEEIFLTEKDIAIREPSKAELERLGRELKVKIEKELYERDLALRIARERKELGAVTPQPQKNIVVKITEKNGEFVFDVAKKKGLKVQIDKDKVPAIFDTAKTKTGKTIKIFKPTDPQIPKGSTITKEGLVIVPKTKLKVPKVKLKKPVIVKVKVKGKSKGEFLTSRRTFDEFVSLQKKLKKRPKVELERVFVEPKKLPFMIKEAGIILVQRSRTLTGVKPKDKLDVFERISPLERIAPAEKIFVRDNIAPLERIGISEKVLEKVGITEKIREKIKEKVKVVEEEKLIKKLKEPEIPKRIKEIIKKIPKGKSQGWVAQAIKAGKWKSISKPLSKKKAGMLGQKIVDETIAATFQLIKKGTIKKVPKKQDIFSPSKKFRDFEIYRKTGKFKKSLPSNTFIELRKHRLDTRGEVMGIKAFPKRRKKKR